MKSSESVDIDLVLRKDKNNCRHCNYFRIPEVVSLLLIFHVIDILVHFGTQFKVMTRFHNDWIDLIFDRIQIQCAGYKVKMNFKPKNLS